MDSAMIGKISKAREYAQEPERMTLASFTVLFNGRHADLHRQLRTRQVGMWLRLFRASVASAVIRWR